MTLNKKAILKLLLLMAFIGSMMVFSHVTGLHKRFSVEGIRDFILGLGVWGPLFFYGTYLITSIVLFPASLLSTASGVVWGPLLGTFYTVTAATLASTAPFFISRIFGRECILNMTQQNRMGKADLFLSKNGFVTIVLLRLIPFFPWDVVNYFAGICGFRFRDYILGTIIGIIPASFTYNLIGASLGKPLDPIRIAMITATVILTIATTLLYLKFGKRSQT